MNHLADWWKRFRHKAAREGMVAALNRNREAVLAVAGAASYTDRAFILNCVQPENRPAVEHALDDLIESAVVAAVGELAERIV